MKKTFKWLSSILLIIVIFPALGAEQTVQQKIADLEAKLPTVSGREKVDTLNRIASECKFTAADKCIKYGKQALELAKSLDYPKGEGNACNCMAVGYAITGDTQKGLEYFQKALEIFTKSGDTLGQANALNNIGNVYRRTGRFEKALEYYRKALNMQKKRGDKEAVATALCNMGNAYGNLSNHNKALEYHLDALKRREELGDEMAIAESLYNIGNQYHALNKRPEALEYFEKALKTFQKLGNKYGISDTFLCIGLIYSEMEKYRRALEYLRQSEKMAEELGDKRGLARTLGSIGSIYNRRKDYPRALDYFHRSMKILEKIDDKSQIALTCLVVGDCHIKLREYGDALKYIEKGLEIGEEIKSKGLLMNSYGKFSQLYAARGDYKKALEYYKRHHQTDKEILNETVTKQMNELRAKYDAEKKAKEIEVLKRDKEVQRITRNTLIGGFVLVLIILILLFKKYLHLFAFWKKEKYVGQFRLTDKVGSGAMGTIYKAHGIVDKSSIAAVKILREEFFSDDSSKKRFKREAAIIDKLDHPNIIKIIERGEHRESLFTAMEFLEGITLERKINNDGQLAIKESLHIMIQVAGAIAFIHGKNIIHRDLKPANIMLIEKDGNPNFVKLLDFGLAKMEFQTRLTQSGNFVGTLEYVSPEQILDSDTSSANDIFAFGVTCYRMLCGKSPFPGETAIDIMRGIIGQNPLEVSDCRDDVPAPLNDLVMKMMDKSPLQRPSAQSIFNTLKG